MKAKRYTPKSMKNRVKKVEDKVVELTRRTNYIEDSVNVLIYHDIKHRKIINKSNEKVRELYDRHKKEDKWNWLKWVKWSAMVVLIVLTILGYKVGFLKELLSLLPL